MFAHDIAQGFRGNVIYVASFDILSVKVKIEKKTSLKNGCIKQKHVERSNVNNVLKYFLGRKKSAEEDILGNLLL